jgi:hypothetical protein
LERSNTIKGFQFIECSEEVYLPISSDYFVTVGDNSVHVFDAGSGQIFFGDEKTLALRLRSIIDSFSKRPFLLKEMGEFLCDKAIQARADKLIQACTEKDLFEEYGRVGIKEQRKRSVSGSLRRSKTGTTRLPYEQLASA